MRLRPRLPGPSHFRTNNDKIRIVGMRQNAFYVVAEIDSEWNIVNVHKH